MNLNNSLTDAQVHFFFKYCSVLNATAVINAFLSCTLLSLCFFFTDDVLGKQCVLALLL